MGKPSDCSDNVTDVSVFEISLKQTAGFGQTADLAPEPDQWKMKLLGENVHSNALAPGDGGAVCVFPGKELAIPYPGVSIPVFHLNCIRKTSSVYRLHKNLDLLELRVGS